jgi:hypothetical protein
MDRLAVHVDKIKVDLKKNYPTLYLSMQGITLSFQVFLWGGGRMGEGGTALS